MFRMNTLVMPIRVLFLFATVLILSACGGSGSDAGTTNPPVTPPPATGGLPTDASLMTSADPNAGRTNDDATRWFDQNAKVVRSLTADPNFTDLDFLASLLQDKRLVMLGESSHGVREYSQAKVRLIKYLHKELGYNVLAFEGGMFDCEFAQGLIQLNAVEPAMDSCLFGVWQTETLRELFAYVASTRNSSTPLRLTGFDVQASGNTIAQRPNALGDLVARVSFNFAEQVRQQDDNFVNLTRNALAAASASDPAMVALSNALTQISNDYAALADYLDANMSLISANDAVTETDVRIAIAYARSSPDYATQIARRFTSGQGNASRDRGMAANLIALVTQIYPDDKIIGWAHNAHLRHQGTGFVPDGNMGALTHNELAAQMYTIGLYMYRGQHTFNDRTVQDVSAPLDFSLEAIFHSKRQSYLFLDFENASTTDSGAAWLDQVTPTWAWGSFQVSMRLRDEYDGVLIIDSVNPPIYR